MVIKDLIDKSWYVANGYIESFDTLGVLEQYIIYNYDILKQFRGIVIATTYKERTSDLIDANSNLWKQYFPECILIDIKENRGHSFGIADSENALIDFCKEKEIDWICKSSNDVIFDSKILDIEIHPADLYYLNGISYETLYTNNFDYEKIYTHHFYPQTNFYFINISKIDYLYDKKYVDETYQYRLTIKNYNNRIWDYIPGWACEQFLINCCERNNLTKLYILPKHLHIKLCEVINQYKIGDPSHKNIFVNGVCHFQYPNQPVIEIY